MVFVDEEHSHIFNLWKIVGLFINLFPFEGETHDGIVGFDEFRDGFINRLMNQAVSSQQCSNDFDVVVVSFLGMFEVSLVFWDADFNVHSI